MLEDEKTAELLKRREAPRRERPPGSRSILSQASAREKVLWFIKTPIRALMCLSLVTAFFLTYFGFIIPVMWARRIWPRLYWFVEGKLYRWLQGFIGTWGYTAGYDVFEYGDDVTKYYRDERVLVMCNHQSTADVPTLMACLQSKGVASRKTLWLMDVMFRWSPFGIIGSNHGDYFIRQGKATREKEILKLKEHLRDVFWDRDRRWVILFPEGGFYHKRVESSQRYGKLNGFPHLKYVTLPRMGAVKAILEEVRFSSIFHSFSFIYQKCITQITFEVGPRGEANNEPRERSSSKLKLITDTVGDIREKKSVKETRPPIKYVLDVTIAYPNGIPLSLATLGFGTREKCDIAVHYKIFRADEVPFDNEEKLRDWMYGAYEEKDKMLVPFILPFISDEISAAMKRCLRRADLAKLVAIIEIPPNTLRLWFLFYFILMYLLAAQYYETGEFVPGERGKRVVFSWGKIISQYVFWFASFYAQYRIYSWIVKQVFIILASPFM
ncbi:hypothetical protein Angca_007838 [Angiostrongylus cantonensis]|nr:hypothetical protein Angca_007838 [Angiostrongylus cantonensis]